MHARGVSRSRLNRRHLGQFPSESLFDRLARAVCEAECLPRKELLESWELARRVRRRLRGGRVVELAAGHGLVAATMLLLDDSSPSALCVDVRRPASSARLWASLQGRWDRLRGRLSYIESNLADVPLGPEDLVVAAHACGGLTDVVLERAVAARARVALMPCCHEWSSEAPPALEAWMDGALAQDVARVARLEAAGYEVRVDQVPADVTPKNRVIIASPRP